MTSNYFTLARIAQELDPVVTGQLFLDAYSLRPNEVRLRFDGDLTLVAVLQPMTGALFFTQGTEGKPSRNIRSFFEQAHGKAVKQVVMSDVDRQITLELEDEHSLTFSYFGHPNVCLTHSEQLIECFKKRGIEQTTTHVEPTSTIDQRVGKKIMKEIEYRFQSYEHDLTRLADEIMAELRTNSVSYLYSRQGDYVMSPIKLYYLEAANWERADHETTNQAVRAKIVKGGRASRDQSKRAALRNKIESAIERTRKAMSDMRRGVENSDRSTKYAAIGNAILMNAPSIGRGTDSFTVEIEGRDEIVKLDPAKSAYENAEQYFEKSRVSKARKSDLAERTKQLLEEQVKLDELLVRINDAADVRELEEIERVVSVQKIESIKQTDQGPMFRKFIVAGGLSVLVGKNAKQNDELTTKFAKKEDIWLHARGVPGSHVVLQIIGAKNKQVPKEAIEQAAEIAAFYSDAKTQSIAPVSYTQRKFVRKPKGAHPGAVILEREEVIMVRPQLRVKEQ